VRPSVDDRDRLTVAASRSSIPVIEGAWKGWDGVEVGGVATFLAAAVGAPGPPGPLGSRSPRRSLWRIVSNCL
jgi:hypothetical protein